MRRVAFLLACALSSVGAQGTDSAAQRPFTLDDALDAPSWSVGDLTRDGRWLAATVTARRASLTVTYRRDGDPTWIRPSREQLYVIESATGVRTAVLPQPRTIASHAWSPDGSHLAIIAAATEPMELLIWDRAARRLRTMALPGGQTIAENSTVQWSANGRRVHVAVRSAAWRTRVTADFARLTAGPITVMDGTGPFLDWDALRRESFVRGVSSVDVVSGTVTPVIPEQRLIAWQVSEDDSVVSYQPDITAKTDYDVIFGTDSRLETRGVNSGTPTVVLPTVKGVTLLWAPDRRRYAYVKDGVLWSGVAGRGSAALIAGDTSKADTSADTRARRMRERFTPVRFDPTGSALVARNRAGLWLIDLRTLQRASILAGDDSLLTTPRVTVAAVARDGGTVHLTSASRTTWDRRVLRWTRAGGRVDTLLADNRMPGGFAIARDADVAVWSSAASNRLPEVFVANSALQSPRQLSDAGQAFRGVAMARTELLTYHDADGSTRNAVVYLPADFRPGEKRPTVFEVYEEFFDDRYAALANLLTSRGYVYVNPSVGFETGYPGEAWLKGVTAAANAVVERGIADSSRLGLQGTSYGGYATNLLITQTNRFRAAVNVSGKVDIISFYTDSPRLGVRNTHAAEKSQDRLGATLWEQPQKYVAHSAVMFADRIRTPLLLITGKEDHNVPADNTREMYYALRRLGRTVSWVNYTEGGHGWPASSERDYRDYWQRISEWYDRWLKRWDNTRLAEATSLFGEPLVPSAVTGPTRERLATNLAAAKRAYDRTPSDADSIIWYARRLGYLGQYRDAITVLTQGVAQHPGDARMYRHRGHRYISVRQFDDATRDLETAARLVRGQADSVEPDGAPNARNIPTSTLHSNIRYHLGLARYLSGDFAGALAMYDTDRREAKTPDALVAASYWTYMILRRLGREREAAAILEPISPSMDIIENQAYHRLLLLNKGVLPVDSLVARGGEAALDDVTVGYGVGNWHFYNGRRAEAEAMWRRVVSGRSQWPAFGYIAAEADLRRMERTSTTTSGR
jgi:dipeptidyl aminopeptidase/acylaminoacyl peptidase